MKEMMTNLQIKCEKLQLQKDQFEKASVLVRYYTKILWAGFVTTVIQSDPQGEKEANAKLGSVRADLLKTKRTATKAAGAVGVDEEEVRM